MKVLLILADAMRPDSLAGKEKAEEFLSESLYTLCGRTTFPPTTLPCHMSLMHSVETEVHGTYGNEYVPMKNKIKGLFETVRGTGKRTSFFYDWEELRDLSRPGSLNHSVFIDPIQHGYFDNLNMLSDMAISAIKDDRHDFVFLYSVYPDAIGHDIGWMTDEYHKAVCDVWDSIDRIKNEIDDDCAIIVMADHGGHGDGHWLDIPEDMNIPVIIRAPGIEPGVIDKEVSIKDIAPTVTKLLGIDPDPEWEGNSII